MHRFGVVAAAVAVLMVQGCFKSGDKSEKAAASQQSSSVSSLSSSSSSLQTVHSSVSSYSSQASSSSETDQSVSSQNSSASSTAGVPVPPSGASSSSAAAGAAVHSVALSVGLDELSEGNTTNAEITATFSDGKTKKIPFGFQWKIGNPNVITADGTRLTAKAEGTTAVQAVVNGKRSPVKRITVYKEIHGHRLPPEPDPQVNNSTLLGVDVNHNGVRDDVERWIYETYKDKHPIYIDIAMQAARGYKLVLEKQPITREEAKVVYPVLDATTWCESYYMIYAKYFNEPLLVSKDIDTQYFRQNIYFNTKERLDAYTHYDASLSGGSYPTPQVDINMKSYCDFNTSKYGKE